MRGGHPLVKRKSRGRLFSIWRRLAQRSLARATSFVRACDRRCAPVSASHPSGWNENVDRASRSTRWSKACVLLGADAEAAREARGSISRVGLVQRNAERVMCVEHLGRRPMDNRVPEHHVGLGMIARSGKARVWLPFRGTRARCAFIAPDSENLNNRFACKTLRQRWTNNLGLRFGRAEPQADGRPWAMRL